MGRCIMTVSLQQQRSRHPNIHSSMTGTTALFATSSFKAVQTWAIYCCRCLEILSLEKSPSHCSDSKSQIWHYGLMFFICELLHLHIFHLKVKIYHFPTLVSGCTNHKLKVLCTGKALLVVDLTFSVIWCCGVWCFVWFNRLEVCFTALCYCEWCCNALRAHSTEHLLLMRRCFCPLINNL